MKYMVVRLHNINVFLPILRVIEALLPTSLYSNFALHESRSELQGNLEDFLAHHP